MFELVDVESFDLFSKNSYTQKNYCSIAEMIFAELSDL